MPSAPLQFVQGQLFVTPKLPPASQIVGRTFIITGANSGLGLAAAQNMHTLGASKLVLACRSASKGAAARTAILARPRPLTLPSTIVEVWELDMINSASVKAFAARLTAEENRIDGVLLNAGILTREFHLVEGDESTLTVNVISTFLLGMLLLAPLSLNGKKHGTTPYITVTGSAVHLFANTKEIAHAASGTIFATLSDPKKADMVNRYNLSKLLVLQCVRQLAATSSRVVAQMGGANVVVNCVAPGWCKSPLFRGEDGGFGPRMALKMIGRTTDEGARCMVSAVCAGEDSHGQYLSECKIRDVGPFIVSKEGKEMEKKVWGELKEKWRVIAPGAIVFQ